MMKKEVLLTISLLASNRKDTIRKCLDSLIPIRKAVSSELIIVDTSGNPEIRSILEEYTDKIIPFTWCNDFAKARNTGLEQAKGEWFLFLDDDEWFIDCKEIIQFFTEGYHKQCGHGTYIVRSFFDKEKLDYSDAELIRLFRLHEGMKFVSKIHEYMTPVSGSCARLKAIAEHSGYYYKTKEEKKKHFERNYKLLVEMLEEEPYNLHLNTQLAQEYFSVDNYEKLYECGKYGLEICNKIESSVVLKEQAGINNIEQCYTQKGTFYIAMLIGLRRTHHLKEGVKIGQQALEDTNMSNLCRACVFINLADCYYQIGSYKEAKNYVEQYLYLAETIPKDEHKYYIEVQALLVSNALQEWQIIKAYSILICCGLKENDLNVLKMYINNLRWDAPKVFVYEMIMEAIIEAMLHNPKEDMFLELLHMIVKQKGLQEGLFVCLRAWELSGRSGWDIIVEKLSKVSITNWHLLWIKAKSGKNEERVAEHLCKL
ncbi:MAG: glycosyltransferase, partial [Lachnospiraceae bacterium]|nr:glycosyltransferase [Lachnospiraceae bacterium]